MRTVVATLSSVSPYSQSGFIQSERGERETADEHERRCWRERLHVDSEGRVFIPPMQFKKALDEGARGLGIKIKGRGHKTYGSLFAPGVMVTEGLTLDLKAADVPGEWLIRRPAGASAMSATGQKGSGGTRVARCYPRIDRWSGEMTFYVLDDLINEDIFKQAMERAGLFVGIGRFRPQNGGFYGRFRVERLAWSAEEAAA